MKITPLPLIGTCLVLLAPGALGLGFGNGVKIGELSHDSVVVWTRLTQNEEADHRVNKWDPKLPFWQVPGMAGELRIALREDGGSMSLEQMPVQVGAESDYCHQVRFADLKPATKYVLSIRGVAGDEKAELSTSFTTAPLPSSEDGIRFTVSTCQDFLRRDDMANGHRIYKSMLAAKPDFFIQTGDTLYYDRANPFAKDIATARYKWNRIYALPYLRDFHKSIPSYWMHDDHDVLKDDCWPGQNYGDLTWDQGLKVWGEQIPQSDEPYRTFRWGKHLQIWLPEGREFRSPNTMEDGPEKTILGAKQWKWLEKTMRESDATFKLYVSATPVVGPDRKNKNDNHANEGFKHEGQRLRKLLSSIPGCFVINGDRHWQYCSIDPETKLNEFGSGPASDQHAAGFRMEMQKEWQPFLRIKGGYLSVEVVADEARVVHHDVDGKPVNKTVIPAQ
ncbi:alkaline phosphatase D family protein [Haloferula sp.]|uniref:alkaline phosphatase D family protein n=1 Tax=Haloferula sp. TaxID=2497595 RepID=UPI00329D13D2